MNPIKDLTVRLTGVGEGGAKELSDTTDDDGYFSIALGKGRLTYSEKGANIIAEGIAELFAKFENEAGAKEQPSAAKETNRVEILKQGKLVHEDPFPIELDGGSVYREYVISEKGFSSASDFRGFVSDQRQKPPSSGSA